MISQSTKLLLGAVTIWPIIYIVMFMFYVFSMFGSMQAGGDPSIMATTFPVIFGLHFLTIILSLGMMVYYIVHAIKDEELTSDYKIIWVLVIVMAGMIGMPIYWWLRIWSRPEPAFA